MNHKKSFSTNQNVDNQKTNVEFDSLKDFGTLNMRQRSDLRRNLEDKENKTK